MHTETKINMHTAIRPPFRLAVCTLSHAYACSLVKASSYIDYLWCSTLTPPHAVKWWRSMHYWSMDSSQGVTARRPRCAPRSRSLRKNTSKKRK